MTQSNSRINESFKEFHRVLSEATKLKQIMDIHTFKRYEPLFRFSASKQKDIRELSDEFFRTIDPYSPLTIVDTRGEEILKLPPIFFPIKNISSDNKQSVDTYYNMMQSELPSEKSAGVKQYTKALLESQVSEDNREIVRKHKETFKDCYEKILNIYSEDPTKEIVEIDDAESDGIEWD